MCVLTCLPAWVRRAMKAPAAGDARATRCAGGWRPATQSSTIAGRQVTTERAVDKSKQQPTIAIAPWRRTSGGLRKDQRVMIRRRTMSTRRTSKEEEDFDKNKEEDCAAAATAAPTAAATTAATADYHASSAATASDQEVAAVVAARGSGLRRSVVVVAAAAEQNAIVDTCFVCVFLVNVRYLWHRIPCFEGRSLRIPAGFRVPEDSGTNYLALEWFNSYMCSVESERKRGNLRIPRNGARQETKKKNGMHNLVYLLKKPID